MTIVEFVVPYHSDGGVVCMYEERIFSSYIEADDFLREGPRCWGEVGPIEHACAANGWDKTLPINQVSVRVRHS